MFLTSMVPYCQTFFCTFTSRQLIPERITWTVSRSSDGLVHKHQSQGLWVPSPFVLAVKYTLASKNFWTPARETKILKIVRSWKHFQTFFDHSRGTPPPDLPLPPVALPPSSCHHRGSRSLFVGVHKHLDTFSCCCKFLNIAATWTVYSLLQKLSLSSWTYYIHFQRNCA